MRCVRKRKDVQTPKLPPPPPREAQNRSELSSALAWSTHPLASTISSSSRLSIIRPYGRDRMLWPPPRVNPAMPVLGQRPFGTANPSEPSVSAKAKSRRPVCTVAVSHSWSTSTWVISLTSITMPASTPTGPRNCGDRSACGSACSVTRPAHGVDYVLRLPGEDDDQREPVEEGVELLPGRVVLRLTW